MDESTDLELANNVKSRCCDRSLKELIQRHSALCIEVYKKYTPALCASGVPYRDIYDPSCNLSCPSCRATKIYITEGPAYERKNIIQQKIINEIFGEPHTRYCKVNVTGSGDPFGSKIFRELLFSIDGSKYPNVHISYKRANGRDSFWIMGHNL